MHTCTYTRTYLPIYLPTCTRTHTHMHTHTRAHRISFPTLSLSCLICTRLGLVFVEVSGIAEPATLQAMSDSDVDNLSALGDAEEVAEEGEGGGHMKGAESEYDIPSSPELQCSGCPASSKSECPLEALKGLKGRRIAWGKTSTRKVKCRRTGKRLRVIRKTGEWCRICYNIWRLRYKRKYKGDINNNKSDLESKDEARKAMENSHAEYIHQKAGGRSRVNSLKGKVVAKLHYSVKVEYPARSFTRSRSTRPSSVARRSRKRRSSKSTSGRRGSPKV